MQAQETTAQAAEKPDHDDRLAKAQVVTYLWSRLDEAGLKRPKGMTQEAWKEMRLRLTARLAYMERENLVTLAESLIEAGKGPFHQFCPPEVTIWGFARGLQKPPVTEARIVTSWLASVEGPPALAAGYEVELFRHLMDHPRPPGLYDMRQIRAAAEANRREVALIRERIGRETASPADRQWLEAYLRDRDRVREIIARGERGRARK